MVPLLAYPPPPPYNVCMPHWLYDKQTYRKGKKKSPFKTIESKRHQFSEH